MSHENLIQALIFDIGQVIVRVHFERAVEALAGNAGVLPTRVRATMEGNARLRDFQEGRITEFAWYKWLSAELGLSLDFEGFCNVWNSALDNEPILDEDLFARLATRYRLVLLSNTDPIHAVHLEARFGFPRHFAARVYSFTVGASKPSPAIYRHAIAQAGVEPHSILYVDDSPEYVEAGRRAGIEAHRFENSSALLAELRARKLLP